MNAANWENRTLFHYDNLPVLRGMNSESVDLIATDPPFNKSKDFHAAPDSLAAGASFQDRWSWEKDVHQEWADQITDDYPRLMEAIESARFAHSDGMGAFMCFMAVRLLEMRRVLKSTGSIYIHCDPTASHYLKAVMDAIFGWQNFRNEIVWCYAGGGIPKRDFPRKHDIILRFSKTADYKYSPIYRPYTEGTQQRGRTQIKGKYFKAGLNEQGTPVNDWWADVKKITSPTDPEKVGWPTQKSLDLYERIIKASSDKDDIVFDPFAGCATTCISAERLSRRWVGIDIWDKAHAVVIERLKKEGLSADGDSGGKLALLGDIHYVTAPPVRTDDGEPAAPNLRTKIKVFEPRGPKMSRADMYRFLLGQHGAKCQGCDREFDDPRYLDLDHNTPRSDGGINHISNRILLCGPCNRLKSNTLTLSGLRKENKKLGFMVSSEEEHPLMRAIREERGNAPPSLFD